MIFSKKKLLSIITGICFISLLYTPSAAGLTYKFDAEENDEHIWTVMVGMPDYLFTQGSKIRLNISAIYNGTWETEYETYVGTILNCTIDTYSTFYTFPIWQSGHNDSLVVFNDTTWEFYIDMMTDWQIAIIGMLLIIPSPLNLTWIGDYLNTTSIEHFENYTVNGNSLTMHNITSNIDYIFTFFNNGTLSEYKIIYDGVIGYHLKYGDYNFSFGGIPGFEILTLLVTASIVIVLASLIKKNKYRFIS